MPSFKVTIMRSIIMPHEHCRVNKCTTNQLGCPQKGLRPYFLYHGQQKGVKPSAKGIQAVKKAILMLPKHQQTLALVPSDSFIFSFTLFENTRTFEKNPTFHQAAIALELSRCID